MLVEAVVKRGRVEQVILRSEMGTSNDCWMSTVPTTSSGGISAEWFSTILINGALRFSFRMKMGYKAGSTDC